MLPVCTTDMCCKQAVIREHSPFCRLMGGEGCANDSYPSGGSGLNEAGKRQSKRRQRHVGLQCTLHSSPARSGREPKATWKKWQKTGRQTWAWHAVEMCLLLLISAFPHLVRINNQWQLKTIWVTVPTFWDAEVASHKRTYYLYCIMTV